MSARNRELVNLIVVGLLMSAALRERLHRPPGAGLVRIADGTPAFFFALYLVAHMVARYTVPYADPYLLPLAGLLSAISLTEIYRLNTDDAFRQGIWVVVGVALFAFVLIALRRDYRRLESYKYLFGLASIFLLMLPALPGIGATVNGARLWVRVGSFQFQPGELAKIFLIVFLAGLPAREARGAGAGADQGLRAAARDLGRRDARPRRDEGPRQRAPLLRDLPGDGLHGDRARARRRRGPRAVRRRRGVRLPLRAARAGARLRLARPVEGRAGHGLPERAGASTRSATAASAAPASARGRSRTRAAAS